MLEIPGTQGFMITPDGVVVDPSGNVKKSYINGDGYPTVSVKTTTGAWTTFGVHRLLALTYIDNDDREERIEVNHVDGNRMNFSLDNLEWVTPRENNIHSEIFKEGGREPIIIGRYEDAVVGFTSVYEVRDRCELEPADVWNSIKTCSVLDGWRFTYRRHSDPLPAELRTTPKIIPKSEDGWIRSIKMLDIDSGNVVEYASIAEAARHHGTSPSHIYQCIPTSNTPRFFRKRYQVAYTEDVFPAYTAEEYTVARNRGRKAVGAVRVGTGECVIFESASDFVRETGLSKKAITSTLASGRVREVGGWVFTYKEQDSFKLLAAYLRNRNSD